MRLLFVCTDLQRGGAERHWATLAPALQGRGAEVRVLCLNDEGPLFHELRSAGVPAACAHLSRRTDVRGLRRALAVAGWRPDVVLTQKVSPQIVGQAIAWLAGAAHVYNEHTPLTAAGELLAPRPHQRALIRLVAPVVDGVIEVTELQRYPLVRLGYRVDRIETVANGLFPQDVETRAGREETRRGLGLGPGDFAVACVANLRPEKGGAAFVAAIARAARDGAPVRGVLVGDGPERGRIEALVAADPRVRLVGSRPDVPDVLAACDALCLLSEAEALPMSVLEAMALGLPVVATDVGGVPDAVADGQTGFVVAPGDVAAAASALGRLAADPAHARAMGAAGRARQRERFDGDAMAAGYMRAMERLARR